MKKEDFKITTEQLIKKKSEWVRRYGKIFLLMTIIYTMLLLLNFFIINNNKLYFATHIFYLCCLIYFSTLGLIATIQIQKIKKKIEK